MTTRLAPWNWFGNDNLPIRKSAADKRSGDQVGHLGSSLASPLSPVDELHNDIDRLFESVFRGFDSPWALMHSPLGGLGAQEMKDVLLRPRLDLTGDEKAYTVTVELPGVDPDDVTLEIRDKTLLLRGEKKRESSAEEKGVYRMERAYGSFERVLPLPEDAKEDAITASHKDGVLCISIPRKEEIVEQARKIAINKAE